MAPLWTESPVIPRGGEGGNGVESGGEGSPLRGEDPNGRRIGVSPDILALSNTRIHRCSVGSVVESPTSRYNSTPLLVSSRLIYRFKVFSLSGIIF